MFQLLEGSSYVFQFGYWNGERIPWTYSYQTSSGSAGADDFSFSSGTGAQNGGIISIIITSINDTRLEPDEDFFLSIEGVHSDIEIPYSDNFTFTIIDDDQLSCRFDVDGNGSIDTVELGYSEAWATVNKVDTRQELYRDELNSLNERIEGLKSESNAIDSLAKATLVKYLSQVVSLGAINTVAELVPAVTSIAANTYNVLFQGQSSEAAAKDAWTDMLDVLNNAASNPIKMLPLLSLIKNTNDALNSAEQFTSDLIAIQDNIKITQAGIAETNQKIANAEVARDAIIQCLSDAAAQGVNNLGVDNVDFQVTSKSVNFAMNSSSSTIAAASIPEVFALRNDDMPSEMYIAAGTAQSELIYARPTSPATINTTVLVSSDAGDDTINVYKGSIYINNPSGNDAVVFRQESGELISVEDITYASITPANGVAFFGIRNDLVVGSEGIENFTFIEGNFNSNLDSNIARVYRMYDSAFDRAPDGYGLNNWTANLDRGMVINDIATGFINSQEFQNTYGSLSNDAFVEQLYENILGRGSDAAGKATWVIQLDTGGLDRAGVLVSFSESAEHIELTRDSVQRGLWDVDDQAAIASRFYYASLDRGPDASGLFNWATLIKGGAALADVADGFTNSQEFQNTYGALSNDAFVELMYQNVLNRASDSEGKANWTNALNEERLDQGDVLLGFSESAEHQISTFPLIDYGFMLA